MAKDIIQELKDNPRILIGSVFICAFVVMAGLYLNSDDTTTRQPLQIEEQAPLLPSEGLPSDFYASFPVPEPAPPAPPPAAPPKQKERVSVRDLFTIKEAPPPTISQEEILRRQMIEKRRSIGTVKVAQRNAQGRTLQFKTVFEDQSRDTDFGAHDLAKSIATFPVNLDRVLTADRFISAVLYTEVKSELPSKKVIAMVDQDVFAAHGRKILIPKGSRVLGEYEPLDEQGAQRLQINWYRILTPDGINVKLDSETADAQGSAGMAGELDNRYVDRYGTALLFSSLSALAQLSVDTESESQASAADAISSEFGSVTAEAFRQSFDVLPRVRIPRGTRINISPLTDVWFKPAVVGQSRVIPTKELELGGMYSEQRFQFQNPMGFQTNQNLEEVERIAAIRAMQRPITLADLPQAAQFQPIPINSFDGYETGLESSLNANDFPVESIANEYERESLREISDDEFHDMINNIK